MAPPKKFEGRSPAKFFGDHGRPCRGGAGGGEPPQTPPPNLPQYTKNSLTNQPTTRRHRNKIFRAQTTAKTCSPTPIYPDKTIKNTTYRSLFGTKISNRKFFQKILIFPLKFLKKIRASWVPTFGPRCPKNKNCRLRGSKRGEQRFFARSFHPQTWETHTTSSQVTGAGGASLPRPPTKPTSAH